MNENLKQFARPEWMNDEEEIITDMGQASPPRIALAASGAIVCKHDGKEDVWPAETDFVILKTYPKAQFVNFRNFWDKGYDNQNAGPPTCSSNNGIVPNSWAKEVQSDKCESCAKNVKGSGGTEKSRACKSSKQLVLVRADDVQGLRYIHSVPVTAIKGLYTYLREIFDVMHASESQVKTRLIPDPEEHKYVLPTYKCFGYLTTKIDTDYCVNAHKELLEKEADYLQQTQLPHDEGSSQKQIATSETATPYPGEIATSETATPYPGEIAGRPGEPDMTITPGEEVTYVAPVDAPPGAPAQAVSQNIVPGSEVLLSPNPAELSPFQKFSHNLSSINDQKTLNAYIRSEVANNLYVACAEPERFEIAGLIRHREKTIKESNDPVTKIQNMFQSDLTKAHLPGLLDAIKNCDDKVAIKGFKDAFVRTANRLNGVEFKPDIHGTTRNPAGGYPALAQDGSYKQKRGVAVNQAAPPSLADAMAGGLRTDGGQAAAPPVETAVGKVSDLLGDLDPV